MAYTKHHTPSIILESYNVGEADRLYRLFTPEFGLVFAKAQSVRELKSKQRFALQPFSSADVSLVRGKGGWRITNARAGTSLYTLFQKDKEKFRVVRSVLSLLKRLVHGEEESDDIFHMLHNGFVYLEHDASTKEAIRTLEILIVIRLLHMLGYLKHEERFQDLLQDIVFSHMLIKKVADVQERALEEINRSLQASQL